MARSTLEGVAELTKQLEALGKLDDGKALRSAVRVGIGPAKRRAKTYIPVGTKPHRLKNGLLVAPGYAADHIVLQTTINSEKNIASAILTVSKLAFYAAVFVEVGTRKMAAKPWLRRAFIESRDECEEAFRNSMQASLLKAIGK